MAIPPQFKDKLRLPIIGAPLFIASGKDMVVEQCVNGIIGTFPAVNARPQETLVDWIAEIRERLAAAQARNPSARIAPFGINQVMSPLNDRWEADLGHQTSVREGLVQEGPGEAAQARGLSSAASRSCSRSSG